MPLLIQEPRSQAAVLEIVAICCELNQWGWVHIGFLYERGDGSHWICELAWELDCRNRPAVPADRCCWVNINLPRQILEYLATVLETMDQNAEAIPYDIQYSISGTYFNPSSWAYQSGEAGLTCATFVMAVLRGLNLELLDIMAWQSREEDRVRFTQLIAALKRAGIDADRIREMQEHNFGVRFRPEEVCGAVSESSWPVPFAIAEALGQQVLQHVETR